MRVAHEAQNEFFDVCPTCLWFADRRPWIEFDDLVAADCEHLRTGRRISLLAEATIVDIHIHIGEGEAA